LEVVKVVRVDREVLAGVVEVVVVVVGVVVVVDVVVVGVVVEIVVVGVVSDGLEVEIDVNGVEVIKSGLRPDRRPLDKSLNKIVEDLSQQACTSGTNVQARQFV